MSHSQSISPICATLLAMACSFAHAQPLVQAFQKPVWRTYIFVSTSMPRRNLVALARDSATTKAILVFRGGFEAKTGGLEKLQRLALDITSECCGNKEVAWEINPKLFDTFKVSAAPTFVIVQGVGTDPKSYSMVSGDMESPNALKFFAQNSVIPELRSRAKDLYQAAFSNE